MKWCLAVVVAISQLALIAQQRATAPSTDSDENYRRPSGPIPPFTLGYFSGKWTLEWDVPETIFGAGGQISGTEEFHCSPDQTTCDGVLEAEGPDGDFEQKVHLAYDAAGGTVTEDRTDSRGFKIHQVGHVSSDQGFHLITFESAPFDYHGKVVQLKSTVSMTAPSAYRLRVQLSVDHGPFESFGSPWRRKGGGAR